MKKWNRRADKQPEHTNITATQVLDHNAKSERCLTAKLKRSKLIEEYNEPNETHHTMPNRSTADSIRLCGCGTANRSHQQRQTADGHSRTDSRCT